jgi:hypothetical protein
MKRLPLFLLLIVSLASAAEARQSSIRLTCAAAASLVRQQGAVLFDTGPNAYDRYVRDASFCALATRPQPAWIPTRDNPECMVGYSCEREIPFTPFSSPGTGR